MIIHREFQHTAARRRLGPTVQVLANIPGFNTQPPEGGWEMLGITAEDYAKVSTHSRPKAAGGWRCLTARDG